MRIYAVDLDKVRVVPVESASGQHDLIVLTPHDQGSEALIAALSLALWLLERPASDHTSNQETDTIPSAIS